MNEKERVWTERRGTSLAPHWIGQLVVCNIGTGITHLSFWHKHVHQPEEWVDEGSRRV